MGLLVVRRSPARPSSTFIRGNLIGAIALGHSLTLRDHSAAACAFTNRLCIAPLHG
jgi:hypothetical protein